MIASNASPLMYLAKLGILHLLKILFGTIIVPQEVYREVIVTGKEEKFFDAVIIEKAVKEGWIKVMAAGKQEAIEEFAPEIDRGEIALLSLAQKVKPSLLLIDDASARAIAESFGFKVKGTLYVLLRAYKKKLITRQETKEFLKRLVEIGFRISQELYMQVMDELQN